MGAGFFVSDNSTHDLSTSWQAFAVTSGSVAGYGALMGKPHAWELTLDFTDRDGAATVQAALTYTSGATRTIAGASSNATITNLTGTIGVAAISFGCPIPPHPDGTVGTVYVWLKVDATTPTIRARGIRLVCTDAAGD